MPFVEVWVDPPAPDMADIETETMEKELAKRGYRIVPVSDPDDIGRVNHFISLHLLTTHETRLCESLSARLIVQTRFVRTKHLPSERLGAIR